MITQIWVIFEHAQTVDTRLSFFKVLSTAAGRGGGKVYNRNLTKHVVHIIILVLHNYRGRREETV